MNLNEINFSFGGLHCLRDFGMIYVEKSGHPIRGKAVRNEYGIAGVSETVLLPGETRKPMDFKGSLFFINDPPSQAEAQARLRRIAAWLGNGRQQLIFDYEPDVYYLAQVNDEQKWDYGDWIDGGLTIALTAQPYAYNVRTNSAQAVLTGTAGTVALVANTVEPAPIRITLANVGTAAITYAEFTLGAASVRLTAALGFALAAGARVVIDMEAPAGAAYGDGSDALPCAERFDPLLAQPGANAVGITLGYGAGTKGATVTAEARGRQ